MANYQKLFAGVGGLLIGGAIGTLIQGIRLRKLKKKTEALENERKELEESAQVYKESILEAVDSSWEKYQDIIDNGFVTFIDKQGGRHIVHLNDEKEMDEAFSHPDWHMLFD